MVRSGAVAPAPDPRAEPPAAGDTRGAGPRGAAPASAPRRRGAPAPGQDSAWTTSSQAYGSFWKAVPLEPRVVERRPPPDSGSLDEEVAEKRRRLMQLLRRHGVRERPVKGDGCCQFRALADQLYGDEEHHPFLREQVVAQLQKAHRRYREFVPGRFEDYLAEMSRAGTWGDHVTLQAAADALGLRIHVLTDHLTDAFIEVLPAEPKSSKVLTLSFWSEVHYNSVAEWQGAAER